MPIPSLKLALGARMPWFDVVDLEGRRWSTADADGRAASMIMFLSRHSPYVKHVERSIGAATKALIESDVLVLAISANDARAYPSDGRELLKEQAARADFAFPYAIDESQQAAKAFQACCTPEFFVYDRELRLIYHGQYDGSRPDNQVPVTGADVLAAIDATREDEIVSGEQPASLGCSIKWRAGNEPSYVLAF